MWMSLRGDADTKLCAGANRFTAFTSGMSLILFAQARTPRQATASFLLFVLSQDTNNCSVIANFSELGGPDASILQAVCGVGNSFQAVLAAPLGVLLWRLTGSWKTQYYICGACMMLAGLIYSSTMTLTPARTTLEAMREKQR